MNHSVALLLLASIAFGCSPAPATGPQPVVWDRDTCEHCLMAIGDRRMAAQLRMRPGGPAHSFDDLGCALLWLDDLHRKNRKSRESRGASSEPFAELWVRDLAGDGWLDGRSARYVAVANSPMNYGFAAVSDVVAVSESSESSESSVSHEASEGAEGAAGTTSVSLEEVRAIVRRTEALRREKNEGRNADR